MKTVFLFCLPLQRVEKTEVENFKIINHQWERFLIFQTQIRFDSSYVEQKQA